MTLLHRVASVLRWLIHRNRAEQDLNDELEAFVDIAAADKMRDGASPTEARRLALVHLGGIDQAKERVRFGRHGGWLDEVGRDVRYACRTFARNPGFSLVVVLTLAVGIGSSSAIFSLINAIVLRPLPIAEPQELYIAQAMEPDEVDLRFSYLVVEGAAALLAGRAEVAAQSSIESVLIAARGGGVGADPPEPAQLQLVAGDFFGTASPIASTRS